MKRKVALLLAVCVAAAGFSGCTVFPPTSENAGAVLRSWWRDIGEMQKFTDKYLLNYDYDDPFNE
jgi:hypothetical protein